MAAARDVYCYLTGRVLQYTGTDMGRTVNIQRSAVTHAPDEVKDLSKTVRSF